MGASLASTSLTMVSSTVSSFLGGAPAGIGTAGLVAANKPIVFVPTPCLNGKTPQSLRDRPEKISRSLFVTLDSG
jgi:hypothetical protein